VTTYEDKIPPAEQVAPTTQFPEPVVLDEEIGDFELVAGAEPEPRTQWQLFWHRFFRHKLAVFALFTLGVIFVLCFGASWIAPYAKNHQDLLTPVTGPSWSHLFGVDQLGRDYFSEVLYAGQISLKIGIAVGLISTVIGFISGAIAGYFGRGIDNILMRVTDLFLVVPAIAILAIALQEFGYSDLTIIFVLAGLFWMSVARVVRSQVLALREKEFVEAARAAGATNNRIVVRHILPNMIGPLMVNATLSIAAAILTEATLSFLGFGVQPPKSSWGNMLTQAEGTVGTDKVYLLYFPGIMLLLVVICINFLGDGIRDAFDPQTKH
jgi:peptide/nickel transport system permease protein